MKKGFTLIEMLVVIAIIGILAGMLSGTLMNSLRTAKSTACLNNLKQSGYAVQMYRDSYKYFPDAANWAKTAYTEGATDFSRPPISEVLKAYTTPEVFHCPAEDQGYYENGKSSYEWNARLSGRPAQLRGRGGRAPRESMLPILWDLDAFHGDVKTEVQGVDGGEAGDDVEEVEVRHSTDGSRNILYLDNTANPM